MKYRIARKKLKRSLVNLWVKSTNEWLHTRDISKTLGDKDSHGIALKFINYDWKQTIRAGNKVGVTKPTVIRYYFIKELRKLNL